MEEEELLQTPQMLKELKKDCRKQFYSPKLDNENEIDSFLKDTNYQNSLKRKQITLWSYGNSIVFVSLSSFRFTAKLSGKYTEFPHTLHPLTCTAFPRCEYLAMLIHLV